MFCNKCGSEKPIEEFSKNKCTDTGYQKYCKSCCKNYIDKNNQSQYNKKYIKINKDKIKQYRKLNENIQKYQKEYRENNKIKNKKYQIEYRKNNIMRDRSEYAKLYRENNKDKIKEINRLYRLKNKEKIKEKVKLYRQNNKDKINKNNNRYRKEKRKIDKIYYLSEKIRGIIHKSLKNNGFKKNLKTNQILGCTIIEFKFYIESKFQKWMSWENYGLYNGKLNYGWDLDHIKPLSIANTEKDLYELNHYTNFQPLCSVINRDIKKNNY